jgi:hypothetical protein
MLRNESDLNEEAPFAHAIDNAQEPERFAAVEAVPCSRITLLVPCRELIRLQEVLKDEIPTPMSCEKPFPLRPIYKGFSLN